MKRFIFILIMNSFLVCPLFAYPGKTEYRIVTEKEQKTNVNYAINDFYSVYYVYMNVIKAVDIDSRLSDGDIENIMVTIIDRIKKENVVQLQVDDYPGAGPLLVTLRKDFTPKNEPILWIISNYNAQTKKVVAGEEEKDAYGTFFYIIGDKLVKYQYVHKPKKKSELKKMTVNSLADYYLLDDKKSNDSKGKKLLMNEIKRAGDQDSSAMLYLTLSEFYLLDNEKGKAKECIDKAKDVIKDMKDAKLKKKLKGVLPHAEDVIDYYVRYKSR